MTYLTGVNTGQKIELRNQIARSGEGTVWSTNCPGFLAKIYHSPDQERVRKLEVMLNNPPEDPTHQQNHVSIAWPKDVLVDSNRQGVGFIMPEIRQGKTLFKIYNPSNREKEAPGFNWLYLHIVSRNLASVIQSIHAKQYILGDIKPENILVNNRVLVSIIDTDSFQIKDPSTNKIYRSLVGSEEFTPPELIGKDFTAEDRAEFHDLFGLAVIIYHLLFGYHPFSGKWIGSGDPLSIDDCIKKGYWLYGSGSPLSPSPLSIPLDIIHPEIQSCFRKCFTDGHKNPSVRPTAHQWYNALEKAIADLVDCPNEVGHQYAKSYGRCYWCERKKRLNFDIFPTVLSSAKATVSATKLLSNNRKTVVNQPTKSVQHTPKARVVTPINKVINLPTQAISIPNNPSQKIFSSGLPKSNKSINKSFWRLGAAGLVLTGAAITGLNHPYSFSKNSFSINTNQAPTNTNQALLNTDQAPTKTNQALVNTNQALVNTNQAPTKTNHVFNFSNFSKSFKFPSETCGDSAPPEVNTWYPVFVRDSDVIYKRVQSQYCRDAIRNYREELNRTDIQVASFRDRAKAQAFANLMRREVGSGEVGNPSTH